MVARHTRHAGRRAVSGCACIDCGTRYLFTSTYKGNYCPECHETWVARQRGESSSRTPPRFGPLERRLTDPDDSDAVDDPDDGE